MLQWINFQNVESVNGMLFAYNAIDIHIFRRRHRHCGAISHPPSHRPSTLCIRERMNVNFCYARRRPNTNMMKTEERITSQLCATHNQAQNVCVCVCLVSLEYIEKDVCHCSKQASTAPVTNQSQDRSYYPLSTSVCAAYWLCFCATFNFFSLLFVLTFISSKIHIIFAYVSHCVCVSVHMSGVV